MSIRELLRKINTGSGQHEGTSYASEIIPLDEAKGQKRSSSLVRKLFLALLIILTASLSFGIGRLSVSGEKESMRIEYDELFGTQSQPTMDKSLQQAAASATIISPNSIGGVVASKNGSRYHYPHCSGAKQIKEENKLFFASSRAAEAAGYTLAANCKPR